MFERLVSRDPADTSAPRDAAPRVRWTTRLLGNPSAMIVANTATQSVLRLVSNIVLAHLLAPTAFALTSIVLMILTGIQMISDMGIGVLALRDSEIDEERTARLWTLNFVRGLALTVVVLILSEPIAWMYDMPELGDVMRVLSLMPALQGAQSLYAVLALARRDLRPTLVMDIGGRIGGTLVSILVALISPTVWALVAGTLAQFAIAISASHIMSGRLMPRFVLDVSFFRSQWRFSRWIQLSSTFTFISMQIDKALFPFFYGLPAFGLYTIGATFAVIPAQVTQRWAASVFYPLAVQMLRGGEEARARLLRVRLTMLVYTAIVAITVVAGAPVFFFLLYQPTYHDAARFAQLLAVGTYFEVAELSLRHFPLADDTSRFEVISVVLRLTIFLLIAALILAGGGAADLYAVGYVVSMAAGYMFMLAVCVRRGYLRAGPDMVVLMPIVGAQALAYAVPVPAMSTGQVLVGGSVVALVASVLMGLVYVRRGLPSLPRVVAPDVLREEGERELGELPTRA